MDKKIKKQLEEAAETSAEIIEVVTKIAEKRGIEAALNGITSAYTSTLGNFYKGDMNKVIMSILALVDTLSMAGAQNQDPAQGVFEKPPADMIDSIGRLSARLTSVAVGYPWFGPVREVRLTVLISSVISVAMTLGIMDGWTIDQVKEAMIEALQNNKTLIKDGPDGRANLPRRSVPHASENRHERQRPPVDP